MGQIDEGAAQMTQILVVEDEKKTAGFVRKALEEQGYTVTTTENGLEGKELALSQPFNLVILDIMLPGLDGLSILETLRNHGHETPVLFLTAKNCIEDRVKGLKLGADDYLIKPFALAEFLARVEALLRRSKTMPVQHVYLADLEIDFVQQKIFRNHQPVELSQKEFQLLSLLASHPGMVYSKKMLAEKIWNMDFDFDTNIVEVTVQRLRKKIDEGYPVPLIQTVRGVGYVLQAQS